MIETPDQVAQRHDRQRRLHGPPNQEERCVEELEVQLAQAQERAPKCAHCGKPATCFGVYEDDAFPPEYACDECCGHGNEDGWCKEVGQEMEELAAYYLQNREYDEADYQASEREKVWREGFLAAEFRCTSLEAGSYTPPRSEAIRAASKLCDVEELAKSPPFAGNPNEPLVGGLEPDKESDA